jgi:hypothetical protein
MRAHELGFGVTTGVVHDGGGQVRPVSQRERAALKGIADLRKPLFSFVRHNKFQHNLIHGQPNAWHCHAGSRYLYICEDGLVHWCSQQRGRPGIPLEQYSAADLEREYHTVKGCAPFCTINCVHQTAILDDLRERPQTAIIDLLSPPGETLRPEELPASVRALMWLFLGRNRGWFARAALRLLKAD